MTTDKKSLGLYIHVPFCKRKCNYCDFCSVGTTDEALKKKYVDTLCSLIEGWAEKCDGYAVDTVYFGGGTPTVLDVRELSRVLETCVKRYSFAENAEISLEANPATVDRGGLEFLRESGFGRLSLGLQSANDGELRALGRIHSFEDFVATYENARAAGFDNISADLMYGIPEQTMGSFEHTLQTLCKLSVEHISAYCLKVEEGTPFSKMGDSLVLPDEDVQSDMYALATDFLRDAGYEKYEISNFARRGRESRHNLRYWRGEEYLGMGPAAHSFFGGERFAYEPNIVSFANGEFKLSEREKIGSRELLLEYVMLRMRLSEGIDLADFERRFGKGLFEEFDALRKYEKTGHIKINDGRCRFTDEGFFVSNYILSEILDFS